MTGNMTNHEMSAGQEGAFEQPTCVSCDSCPPKFVVSPEEEAILERMRDIKVLARDISERMAEIREQDAAPRSDQDLSESETEWMMLHGRLEGLKSRWRSCQEMLDRANDLKYVQLGHRLPV